MPASEMTACNPDDTVFECAHDRFFLRFSQVQRWGPDVLDFMRFHGVD